MNINDIKTAHQTTLSFEVFPPKVMDTGVDALFESIAALKKANPAFISVTYGAGGSQKDKTVAIASRIKSEYGIEPLAHLTCVGADEADITAILADMKKNGIDNILALRGDVPRGTDGKDAFKTFKHATDLIAFIGKVGGFHVTAAAYPEGHPRSHSLDEELDFLKLKQDLGTVRLNTQLCFDSEAIYRFIDSARAHGITIPISIGIMPVLNPNQIYRMVTLSGGSIPAALSRLYALYGDDEIAFRTHGLEYAKNQVRDLTKHGVDGIHLYTMNKHEAILEIIRDTEI